MMNGWGREVMAFIPPSRYLAIRPLWLTAYATNGANGKKNMGRMDMPEMLRFPRFIGAVFPPDAKLRNE
jgi:hypothetical protein